MQFVASAYSHVTQLTNLHSLNHRCKTWSFIRTWKSASRSRSGWRVVFLTFFFFFPACNEPVFSGIRCADNDLLESVLPRLSAGINETPVLFTILNTDPAIAHLQNSYKDPTGGIWNIRTPQGSPRHPWYGRIFTTIYQGTHFSFQCVCVSRSTRIAGRAI